MSWEHTHYDGRRFIHQDSTACELGKRPQTVHDLFREHSTHPAFEEEAAKYLLAKTTGLDVLSPHGESTPARFVAMLRELTTPQEFKFTTFETDQQDMVIVRDIAFVSVCNHHVVPFMGVAHVAYVPNGKVAGLSKIARTVHYYARQLQVQEDLTHDIADHICDHLEPAGVGIILEAEHLCMTIRGVQAPGTKTITATMRGVFADHDKTAKAEFLSMIGK
jgi:GTP cyclohydrolase IA